MVMLLPLSACGGDPPQIVDYSPQRNAVDVSTAAPNVPFDRRLGPGDGRRAIIAPWQLLTANTSYQLLVNTAALDVDGNQLARNELIRFTTGPLRALRHWIAFATDSPDGAAGGLWIVDERGVPRQLLDSGAVEPFLCSPGGASMIIQAAGQTWWT